MKKVLVIAPHPDDETLGCGGTLLKHRANGDQIYWLMVTNVDEKNGWTKERVESRQKEIEMVSQMYGFTKTFKLDFPTTKLDIIPISDIIGEILRVINEIKPEIIYLPNRSDVHTDHQIVFNAAYSCTKNFRFPFIEEILIYETISETEFGAALNENAFIPNVFNDISDYFERKMEIFNVYESEIMSSPLPRSINSIESFNRHRGSRIGKKYAEAFSLLLKIK